MIYLLDTCVIISNLNKAYKILDMKEQIKEDEVAISNVIVNELKEPLQTKKQYDKLEDLIMYMVKYKKITLIDLNNNSKMQQTLDKIRNTHYRWMTDPEYINMLIKKGKIKPEDRKSLKYKDLGECSLIAIALQNVSNNIIITNDKGNIYVHPYQNIFEFYPEVKIMNYKEFNTSIEELISN